MQLRSASFIALGAWYVCVLCGQQRTDFQGSVPKGSVQPNPLALTLRDAIQRGLEANLGLLTRANTSLTVRAERVRALSALLPQVTGTVGETDEQVNLKTVGINFQFPPLPGFPQIPTIVGPFHYFAAQANLSAKVFDWNARQNLRAAKANESAANLSIQDARDLVVQAVASAYLQIIASASRVTSIQAQVNTAQVVYDRAFDQHNAGTSPAIDVLRAQVELKTQQQRLLAQQNQFDKDKLSLARVIGLPPGQRFDLADHVPFAPLTGLTLDDALRTAFAQRPDYQSAKRVVEGAERTLEAARAEWYPTANVNGFYGAAGPWPNSSHSVFTVTGSVTLQIFNGGRIRSDIEQARATLQQHTDELADLGGQIDFQVRTAFLDIQSAADQVTVAQSNMDLANQALVQARDRFAAGVADTIEVVQAQEAVAGANDSLISALFAHNLAKTGLARALGLAEQGIQKFIEVK